MLYCMRSAEHEGIAQLVEHLLDVQRVIGSSPIIFTKYKGEHRSPLYLSKTIRDSNLAITEGNSSRARKEQGKDKGARVGS